MEVPRPPLRMLFLVALMALVVAYEMNPNFQSWANYQLLRGREWLRYGREWLAYKQRQSGA